MSELIPLLSADLDVQEAFAYYEDYQEGRGAVFLCHLDAAFDQLRRFPESGARFHRSYRRLLVPHPLRRLLHGRVSWRCRCRRHRYTPRPRSHPSTLPPSRPTRRRSSEQKLAVQAFSPNYLLRRQPPSLSLSLSGDKHAPSVNNDVQDALQSLVQLRLRCIGHAANLLWVQFGEWREIPDRDSGTRTVGDWALHIQCPWRFTRGSRIIVAARDFYHYADTDKPYDWHAGGESRFDRLAVAFNAELGAVAHHVSVITSDGVDGFRLAFSPELGFDVFPCAATSSPKHEFWRLFQPATEGRHIVFGTNASEAT